MIDSRSLSDILEFVDKKLEKTCLDIGCGTGQLTRELSHRGYRCLGIDVSHAAVQLAQSLTNRADELSYRRCNIEADDTNGLPMQPYSLITCKLVYAFIKNRFSFLDHVDRLLAHRGTFVVVTPAYRKDSDATPISVDFETTSLELREKFNHVNIIEADGMVIFVCRKK